MRVTVYEAHTPLEMLEISQDSACYSQIIHFTFEKLPKKMIRVTTGRESLKRERSLAK